MRIALITDGIWPYVLGGMQKHSYYLCKYLAQNKVEVHLFHFNQSSYDINVLEFFSDEEKKYITPVVIPFPDSWPFPGHYLYNSYAYSKLVFKKLKEQHSRYDLIYTKGFTGWYLLNNTNRKNAFNCRVGVNFHGYEMFQQPPDFKTKLQHILLLKYPVRYITRKADVVFSYGGKITGIIEKLGVPREKIFELPSGVEQQALVADIITPQNEAVNFVFLGRYERRKGIEELNKAITTLLAENKDVKAIFHFIGPIPPEKKLDLNAVVYHGEVRDKIILQQLLKKCDVLLCPSWSEGMPNVILEAMAAGLAVVATDVGATKIMVNDKTGWLLPSPDPVLIKKTLSEIINSDPAFIHSKKQNAFKLVSEKFVWERLIIEFIDAFTPRQKN